MNQVRFDIEQISLACMTTINFSRKQKLMNTMKALKISLKVLAVVIILAIGGGFLFLHHVKTRALPDYNATIDLQNMSEPVTVYRDQYAIPHIYAKNDADLYRAVGYVMAQDRLWQMDLIRRITSGRLSEVLDPGLVNADLLFRSLRFSAKSEKVLAQTDPKILSCIDAYCDGVNQYIETHLKKLPPEFTLLGYKPEPWTRINTANMIGYMAWDLSMAWDTEVTLYKISQVVNQARFEELLPDLSFQPTVIFPDYMKEHKLEFESAMSDVIRTIYDLGLQVFNGSNNWAVSGKKSESGMPMLANDMHLGLNAPGIWYQMHQVVEGGVNVSGVVLPGQPFVICGHNNDIAWGMTNVMLDDMDFYMETLNPENENQYKLNGQWKELEVVKESIKVKGKDKDTIMENRFTHRGPIISSFKGVKDKAISMRWVGNDFSNEILSVYQFNRAKNWDDFREAASHFTSIAQNIVYADTKGNIGLQVSAGVPIREGNGILIYPGDTTQYDWQGDVPFEQLPYAYNPENGMVSSANNKTAGPDYPYYISHWYDLPNRIERIREMLTAKEKLNADDFKAIQADCNSVFARKFNPVFVQALEKAELNETEKKAFELLKDWNNELTKESSATLIFEQLYKEYNKAVFYDELGDKLYADLLVQKMLPEYLLDKTRTTKTSAWFDNVKTDDKVETMDDDIYAAFTSTINKFSTELGTDPEQWHWGDLHTLTLKHPLGSSKLVETLLHVNKGPYPVKGSFHTVGPYSYPMNDDGFQANHGASHRHIFTLNNWDESQTVIPTGESGIPASDYYCDQTELYINNIYHPDPFTLEEVKKHAKFVSVLK